MHCRTVDERAPALKARSGPTGAMQTCSSGDCARPCAKGLPPLSAIRTHLKLEVLGVSVLALGLQHCLDAGRAEKGQRWRQQQRGWKWDSNKCNCGHHREWARKQCDVCVARQEEMSRKGCISRAADRWACTNGGGAPAANCKDKTGQNIILSNSFCFLRMVAILFTDMYTVCMSTKRYYGLVCRTPYPGGGGWGCQRVGGWVKCLFQWFFGRHGSPHPPPGGGGGGIFLGAEFASLGTQGH